MKKIIYSLSILFLLSSSVGHSQEQVGHIIWDWITGGGRGAQQQQQQETVRHHKRVVIEGDEAEELFSHYSESQKIMDRTDCPWPVKMVEKKVGIHEYNACFDRGEKITDGTRYRCYVVRNKKISKEKYKTFDRLHNSCGEDVAEDTHMED